MSLLMFFLNGTSPNSQLEIAVEPPARVGVAEGFL